MDNSIKISIGASLVALTGLFGYYLWSLRSQKQIAAAVPEIENNAPVPLTEACLGGHRGMLSKGPKRTIRKHVEDFEKEFYTVSLSQMDDLAPFVPKFLGIEKSQEKNIFVFADLTKAYCEPTYLEVNPNKDNGKIASYLNFDPNHEALLPGLLSTYSP